MIIEWGRGRKSRMKIGRMGRTLIFKETKFVLRGKRKNGTVFLNKLGQR